jgi:hypothetical protein
MQGAERTRNARRTASKGPAGGQARIHRAADLPEACPEPLRGLAAKANGDMRLPLTGPPRQDAPPGFRSLTSTGGRGRATGQQMDNQLARPEWNVQP